MKEPKEIPILFSGPMVRAILEGRKWQTRRVMNPQPYYDPEASEHHHTFGDKNGAWIWQPKKDNYWFYWDGWTGFDCRIANAGPYQEGDSLWVRETWTYITKAWNEHFDTIRPDPITPNGYPVDLLYRADGYEIPANWTPSIFMPRWASRLTLKIKNVRVERLHRIGELSAKAEGVEPEWTVSVERGTSYQSYCTAFANLWDKLNAKRGYGWEVNPWVWVIEFKKIQAR